MLDHFWSLSIEEQFYIFWPLIVLKFTDRNIIIISIGLILLSIVVRNINTEVPFSTTFTFGRLDGLSIGSICAIVIRQNKKILERISVGMFFSTASVLFLICIFTRNLLISNPYFIRFGFTLFDLFFAFLIITSLDRAFLKGFLHKIFSGSFFRFFGKYSYGLYVYHWPIYKLSYPVIYKACNKTFADKLMASLFSTFILVSLIIAVALLSFRFIEKPFLRLKSTVS